MELFGPSAFAHEPVDVSEPQLPVYTSISSPGTLLIFETATVAVPLLMARSLNQTLLLTVLSPQESGGSVTENVAPVVVDVIVLFAQSTVAFEQLSCAATWNEMKIHSPQV